MSSNHLGTIHFGWQNIFEIQSQLLGKVDEWCFNRISTVNKNSFCCIWHFCLHKSSMPKFQYVAIIIKEKHHFWMQFVRKGKFFSWEMRNCTSAWSLMEKQNVYVTLLAYKRHSIQINHCDGMLTKTKLLLCDLYSVVNVCWWLICQKMAKQFEIQVNRLLSGKTA